MIVSKLKRQLMEKLTVKFDLKEAQNMAGWLLQDGLNIMLYENVICTEEQIMICLSWVEELLAGRPFDYVIGHSIFYGLKFEVNESVLIPRPETEQLVEQALSWLSNRNGRLSILDIGTGSGCIPITMASKLNHHLYAAIDISTNALETAQANANRHNIEIEFLEEDALDLSDHLIQRKWDLIISNPPYILKEERPLMSQSTLDYEPNVALYAKGEDALVFYRKIAEYANSNLNEQGALMMEMNEFKTEEIQDILKNSGFKNITIENDLFNKERIIISS